MANDGQKNPLGRSLNLVADKAAANANQLRGQVLPCSVTKVEGQIVTVKFEVTSDFTLPPVKMPIAGWKYIYVPVQVGDKGIAIAADARLGGISGLGGGTADLSLPGNLSALEFLPTSNTAWQPIKGPNWLELYGPDGTLIRSNDKGATVEVVDGSITLKVGAISLVVDAAGVHVNGVLITQNIQIGGSITGAGGETYAGAIHTTGTVTGDTDVVAGGISGKTHTHGVTAAPGTTGQPNP